MRLSELITFKSVLLEFEFKKMLVLIYLNKCFIIFKNKIEYRVTIIESYSYARETIINKIIYEKGTWKNFRKNMHIY